MIIGKISPLFEDIQYVINHIYYIVNYIVFMRLLLSVMIGCCAKDVVSRVWQYR